MNGVLQRFYTAFARRDWATMGACYHDQARFSDPVFPDLDAHGVRAMWQMLLTSGTDLRVTFTVEGDDLCRWEAYYTFSRTKRPVHNVITSTFEFRDGLIFRQCDRFSFWRWSRQALGPAGVLMGWTFFLQRKVQATAANSLARAMAE